jgi:hypothetical protein
MMSSQVDVFEQLQRSIASGGIPELLDTLDVQLRDQQRYHDLFKCLRIRARHDLGLPLVADSATEQLTDQQQQELEDRLIDACREIGELLISHGQIRDGWMYLRVVGDLPAAAEVLAQASPNEDNLDEFIEVLLQENVAPDQGFSLILEHYGTCDAITTLETMAGKWSEPDRQAAVGLLVEHVHAELLRAVRAEITDREKSEPGEETLEELVSDRPWLFQDGAYHVDTTHLAATLRAARCLEEPRQLRLAYDLTTYGSRLDAQYQYEVEEPFAETYRSHALFLAARLGENVSEAIQYFQQRATSLEVAQHGLFPMETLMQLLHAERRSGEALEILEQFAKQENVADFVSQWMLEFCRVTGDYAPLLTYCRSQGDLLGFATGLAHAELTNRDSSN